MPRPNIITLTPRALDVDGITADTPVEDTYMIINGAYTSGYDVDALVETVNPSAAGNLTMNGDATDGGSVVTVDPARCVVVNCAGDETSITFTVSGYYNGEAVSEAIVGLNTNIAVGSQRFDIITSVHCSGNTTGNIQVGLNGVATFDTPQHVSVTSSDTETGDWTFSGTDRNGDDISEAVDGPNNTTVASSKNFATVYAVHTSANAVGTVTVGVDGTCDSPWINTDYRADEFNVGVSGAISSGGAMTFSLQLTMDDIFDADFDESTATAFADAVIAGETSSQLGSVTSVCSALRWTITAHTSGSLVGSTYQTA